MAAPEKAAETSFLEDLEAFVLGSPKLRHLFLTGSLDLPPPRQEEMTTFDLGVYPQQVVAERFPSLPPNGLLVQWIVPPKGFLFPLSLQTLILREWQPELVRGVQPYFSELLPQRRLSSLLKDNLLRLPNLTRLELHNPHSESLLPYFGALTKLEVLKDLKHLTSFPLALLPRSLKTLCMHLDPSRFEAEASAASAASSSWGSQRPTKSKGSQSRSQRSTFEIVWSDLPPSLTELNFGATHRFSSRSVGSWPTTLRSLSIAMDSSWTKKDIEELESSLPSLEHLHINGKPVAK